MRNIENTAQRMLNVMHGQKPDVQQVILDPVTISILVSVITNLIKLFVACRKEPGEAVEMARRPERRERVLLNRELRKQFGWFNWAKKRDYCDYIMEYGGTIEQDEMQGLYNDYRECVFLETK
jgi:hypothetical protein